VVAHLQLNVISTVVLVWIQEIVNSYQHDSEATALLQRLVVVCPDDEGLTLSDGIIRYKNKIWVGPNSALQTKLISAFHASPLGGHSGIQATH
jgi:hypothetical protein